jgi:hypothetical protein
MKPAFLRGTNIEESIELSPKPRSESPELRMIGRHCGDRICLEGLILWKLSKTWPGGKNRKVCCILHISGIFDAGLVHDLDSQAS